MQLAEQQLHVDEPLRKEMAEINRKLKDRNINYLAFIFERPRNHH